MRVQSVHVYPVKACRRIDVERAEVEPWGLAGDRRWLVVDAEDGSGVTQRDTTALTRVQPSLSPGVLTLTASGLPDLVVAEPAGAALMDVSVWASRVPASLAGPAADDWLSTALDRKVRLVWLDDPTRRGVDPRYGQPDDRVSFADGYPLLLGNAASLADLNDRIAESASGEREGPLPMTRFRPNVVITAGPAWIEDQWTGGRIRIGEVTFRVPKPCGRCVVTTTDQETGERGREPLRTLARFRNTGQALTFATNMIPENRGHIAVGDPVTVDEWGR